MLAHTEATKQTLLPEKQYARKCFLQHFLVNYHFFAYFLSI